MPAASPCPQASRRASSRRSSPRHASARFRTSCRARPARYLGPPRVSHDHARRRRPRTCAKPSVLLRLLLDVDRDVHLRATVQELARRGGLGPDAIALLLLGELPDLL